MTFRMMWALAIAMTACGVIEPDEKLLASLDGPTRVEIVTHHREYSGDRRYNFLGTKWEAAGCVARVYDGAGAVRDSIHIDCDGERAHTRLVESDDGRLVAIRAGGSQWSLVRVGQRGVFEDCAATLGSARRPALSTVKPLREAAQGIVACNPDARPAVVEELEAIGDHAAAATLVVASVEAAENAVLTERAIELIALLTPEARAAVCTRFGAPLRRVDADDESYERAARLCPLDGDEIADTALRRFRRPGRPTRWEALIAVARRPREAGEAACAALTQQTGSSLSTDDYLLAIAVAGTRCPGLASAIAEVDPCRAEAPASPTEMRARVIAEVGSIVDQPAPRRVGGASSTGDLAVLALHAQGSLPAALARGLRRHSYAIVQPTAAPCSEKLPPGTPCDCGLHDGDRPAFCGARAQTLVLDGRHCAIRFDDERKQVGFARHVCAPLRGRCDRDEDCCHGAVCDERRCVPDRGL